MYGRTKLSNDSISSKQKARAALDYFQKSKEIEFFSLDRDTEKAISNLNISIINLRQKNYKKALEHAQIAENLSNSRLSSKVKSKITGEIKGLMSENYELITYNASTLSAITSFYIALSYENMEMFKEAYLNLTKGYAIIRYIPDIDLLWEEKYKKKMKILRVKLKESLPYLEDPLPKKLPPLRARSRDPGDSDFHNQTQPTELESTKPRVISVSRDKIRPPLAVKNSANLPTAGPLKLPIGNIFSAYIEEAEESKEETRREFNRKPIMLPAVRDNSNDARNTREHANKVIINKRKQENEIFLNDSTAQKMMELGYKFNPSNQSFSSHTRSQGLSRLPIHHQSFDSNSTSSTTKLVSQIHTNSIVLSNINSMEKPKTKPTFSPNTIKSVRLTPLRARNLSEKGNSPRDSVMQSIDYNRKTDLGFLVVLTTKLTKKLTKIEEKLKEIGSKNMEMLDQIESMGSYEDDFET